MYTPNLFFYYEELSSLIISKDKRCLSIKFMDPYGNSRTIQVYFGFWDKKRAKELYDEIIKVNNMNKERERHGPR